MLFTVTYKTNNVTFTIKGSFEGLFNWNMNEITPPGYAINTDVFHRLCLWQQDDLIAYNQTEFQHRMTFGWQDIAFRIWCFPCNPHWSERPKTFCGWCITREWIDGTIHPCTVPKNLGLHWCNVYVICQLTHNDMCIKIYWLFHSCVP